MNFQLSSLFSEKKAAEAAAYFLIRARERSANITLLKLMKLMYLAERESYEKYGFPIIGDRLVSMPHGPVLSRTLNLMNFGNSEENPDWYSLVADKSGRDMTLNAGAPDTVEGLLELSDADANILESTWRKFGRMSANQLRDYTHDPRNCPEWQDPDGSSVTIEVDSLLCNLGYAPDAITSIMESIRNQALLNSKLLPLEG